jgi:hypothetical protein
VKKKWTFARLGWNHNPQLCIAGKRGPVVPNAAYFRRQADICLRLSLITSDDTVSARLLAMARDYKATSEALEQQAAANPPVEDRRIVEEERVEDHGEGLPVRPEAPEST